MRSTHVDLEMRRDFIAQLAEAFSTKLSLPEDCCNSAWTGTAEKRTLSMPSPHSLSRPRTRADDLAVEAVDFCEGREEHCHVQVI